MRVLVTGGAGYIGSVVVEHLVRERNEVVVIDNLTQGHRSAVAPEALFIEGDFSDQIAVGSILTGNRIQAVIHMAALASVAKSMSDPQGYFRENVTKGLTLLDTMLAHNVDKLVFSSTAAVYGDPKRLPISENHPQSPINPYGESKLLLERAISWYHHAYGLKYAVLRYFNAAGASELLGEDHAPECHIIPLILDVALGRRKHLEVFGTDYDTRDGTCERDYVHVSDLATAHLLALRNLDRIGKGVFNLGTGSGYTIRELVAAARAVTGMPILTVESNRRPGDPPILVASFSLAARELGWVPKHTQPDAIIESAWDWRLRHPHGYSSVRSAFA